MSKLILVNGQNVEFALDAQTSGAGTMKTPDLAGATKYQVPAASAAAAAEIAKLGVHGADIASATTTNLETATGELVDVTGTTTITAITLSEGHRRIVRFTGILTLTHGASLVLPGAANITTAAGDFAVFEGYGSSVVRCVGYMRAAAAPACVVAKYRAGDLVRSSTSFVTDTDFAISVGAGEIWRLHYRLFWVEGAGAGAKAQLQFTGTVSAALGFGSLSGSSTSSNAELALDGTTPAPLMTTTDDSYHQLDYVVTLTAATAGTVNLQWGCSAAFDVTLNSHSSVIATRIN
jgi:hypothetical protein